MTDHKFTDDDVIKAYELCFTPKGTNETCAKCPFHKIGLLCKIERDRAALALINRQKRGIEALADLAERSNCQCTLAIAMIDRQHEEIERLNGDLIVERTRRKNAVDAYHEAKSEAIKEFAKRFKEIDVETFAEYDKYGLEYVSEERIHNAIDTLVKEMTEKEV